jgi:site-specific DNA recombinase
MQDQRRTAIIYCRVSSQDQLSGTSLESQERICREYAERQDYSVLGVFIERGESAKTADRTELNRALAFCANKRLRVDFFVVYKLDRFARNSEDHVTVRAMLRRAGTELVSATEPIDRSPVGKLLETMLAGVAEFDNNVRTERTKAGMVERLNQGVWVWPAPLGYYRPYKGSNLVPHPTKAQYIRLIFEQYSRGIYTYRDVAEFISAKGFRSCNGKPISFQQVEKILRNPVYTGLIEAWGQTWAGSFPAIISRELFDRCQPGADLKRAHAAPRSLNNPLFPLRRLVICSLCGEGITGSSSTGRMGTRYPYYHHRMGGCIAAANLPKAGFEERFVDYLKRIEPKPGAPAIFRAAVLDCWREKNRNRADEHARIRREIETLEKERERVFALHRAGVYTNEEFLEQKNVIEVQKNEKIHLLNRGVDDGTVLDEALTELAHLFENPAETWVQLEPTYSRRLEFQRMIFKETVPFDGELFGTAELTCVYGMNREFQGDRSALVAQIRARWNGLLNELQSWRALEPDNGNDTLGRGSSYVQGSSSSSGKR